MVSPFSPREVLPAAEIERIRRHRSHPRPTQFDYLHLKVLRDDIARALAALPSGRDVLDVFCGTRPYEVLFPPRSRVTGLDISDRFGVADVVSEEFLPFEAGSFDVVVSFQAFYFVPDPHAALAEIERVLRPGGHALITVPLVWEYDRRAIEHRFTGPVLERLFSAWAETRVEENGGRGVVWATQTGCLLDLAQGRVRRRLGAASGLTAPLFALGYLLINATGALIERAVSAGSTTLPMNLMVSARRPD